MEEKGRKGKIVAVQLCPGHRKAMLPVEYAEAVEKTGLKGDVHALPDSSRQLLLIERETLDHFDLEPGQVKENITTAGIALMSLPRGCRLHIGTDVVMEITKTCSPCSRMDEIRPGLRLKLAGKRGMLARVISGGIIRRGDSIEARLQES